MMDLFNINFFIAASLGILLADFFKTCFDDIDSDKKECERLSKDSLTLEQVESLLSYSKPNIIKNMNYVLSRLEQRYETLLFTPNPDKTSQETSSRIYLINFNELNKALKSNTLL